MRNLLIFFITCLTLPTWAQQDKVYSLTSDSITFKSSDEKISFSGTLTSPVGKKSFPTLVMVSGTGKQDRNGTMAGHKIFEQIADYLGSYGIAMLRIDDRGTGKTTGIYETATTADFASDALAAVSYLKSRKDIDQKKIGLIGHSEGGAAISIAAAKSADVKFLVSIAGLAMNGLEAQLKQNQDIVAASALPDYDKKRSNEINGIMFNTAFQYASSDSLEIKLNQAYQSWKVKDDIYFKSLKVEFDHFRFPVFSFVQSAKGPWYRYFIRYDSKKTIGAVKVPILAINGDKDLMVAPDENLANWKSYAMKGGNHNVNTVKITGLNHLLLPCIKCDAAEIPKIQAGVSTQALQVIKDWIIKNLR